MKCFDKVNFTALFGALEYFNFGEKIVQLTKLIYSDFEVMIQNNGYFSESIEIQQGVHQGGPASSCYFLAIAEILALNIKGNKGIQGIPVDDILNILNQFADDMDVFSIYNQESLNNVLNEIDKFYMHSGFEISYEKTTIYCIGSLKKSNAKLYTQKNQSWSNEKIKVLGIDVVHDPVQQAEINFQKVLEKSKNVLNTWANRSLSLISKILVFNTLVSSLFVYKMTVLPNMSEKLIKKIEQMCSDYLWNGGRPKIKLKILQASKTCAGLKLVNIRLREMSLKIGWIQTLDSHPDYANLVYKLKAPIMTTNIWRCNLKPVHVYVLGIKNVFWENVLSAWCQYQGLLGDSLCIKPNIVV